MHTEPITAAKAALILDDACDTWDDLLDHHVTQDDVNRVEELLDLSSQAMDREDFTGAWLWAGNALAYIRERIAPLPATV
jgi:hypothetical protein